MKQHTGGAAAPVGALGLGRRVDLGDLSARRRAPLSWRLKNLLANRRRSAGQVTAAHVAGRLFGFAPILSSLSAVVYRPNWEALSSEQALKLKVLLSARVALAPAAARALLAELGGYVDVGVLARAFGGQVTDYGRLSQRLVTDNGVGYIVDAFQNLVELENMKFHGFGTGTNAEAQSDSALQTELTTQYVSDNTRPTGSQTETSANIYRTVGTLSPDSGGTIAVTEHGIFSASSAGVLLDRSKFSAVNLVAGADSLQATYDLTITAGG